MKSFVAFIIIWTFGRLTLAKLDMSKICINHEMGDVIPNPEDCTSYIICESVASIIYCKEGLHFDARRNVCSLPVYAQCNVGSSPDEIKEIEEKNIYYSPFVAIDVMSGSEVDPMLSYDPQHVICRHFGAYFLPHPLHCRLYILCAYGHIHKYSCGSGTMWNFKKRQCEVSVKAECYAKTIEENMEIVSSIVSTTDNPLMVCYTISSTTTDGPTKSTWYPTGSIYNATATGSSSTTPLYPTTDTVTKTVSLSTIPSATVKTPNSTTATILECPSKSQSYLAHPNDCTKYYMCLMGIPVLTSCPVGLYWDSEMEYCDSAKNVICFQKKV